MTDLEHVDAGKKVDIDRVFAFGLPGLLWKRRAIVTVIKYNDDNSEPQTIALDFMANTRYTQPIIDKKIREVQPKIAHKDTNNQPIISLADELSKLAKLKEQGVITEEEFSQMKANLMKKM
jgi:putative oligomerization/nucleic acid binding protein